jgi:hypothetical protein
MRFCREEEQRVVKQREGKDQCGGGGMIFDDNRKKTNGLREKNMQPLEPAAGACGLRWRQKRKRRIAARARCLCL